VLFLDTQAKIIFAAAIIGVFVFGTVGSYIIAQQGGFNVKSLSLLDSIYFTVVTMSTVGYGDITPVSPIAKIFVIVLIGLGLSVFLSVVTIISGDFLNNRLEKISARITSNEKKKLRGHIVLIGTDGVNLAIAKELHEKGTKFVIIVTDKVIADRLKVLGYKTFVADPTSEVDMSEFQIHNSDKVIIDLKESSRMVYSLLVIRALAKGINVIIVAPSPEAERHINELGTFKNEKVISPNSLAADTIIKSMI
jgi:voltage-gated potassium channel